MRHARGGHTILSSISLLMVALCIGVAAANAQALDGSIVGTVTDSIDAAVPGATVSIVHAQTNQERTTVTSSAGVYSFPGIPSGS